MRKPIEVTEDQLNECWSRTMGGRGITEEERRKLLAAIEQAMSVAAEIRQAHS